MRPNDSLQGPKALPIPPQQARKRRALLVNEDPEALRLYSAILQHWGYQVRACQCHEEALYYLGSEAFDVVLVSQGSRKFEGRCVLERAVNVNRRLPVLVIARCLDTACYLEAMQLGAADYLTEPVTVSAIGQVLRAHQTPPSTAS